MFNFTVYAQSDPPELRDLETIYQHLLLAVLPLFGVVLLIMLIWGGITLITSGTNAGKVEQAKKMLTYAVAGILLASLSYLILTLIANYTGNTNILNFEIFPSFAP